MGESLELEASAEQDSPNPLGNISHCRLENFNFTCFPHLLPILLADPQYTPEYPYSSNPCPRSREARLGY